MARHLDCHSNRGRPGTLWRSGFIYLQVIEFITFLRSLSLGCIANLMDAPACPVRSGDGQDSDTQSFKSPSVASRSALPSDPISKLDWCGSVARSDQAPDDAGNRKERHRFKGEGRPEPRGQSDISRVKRVSCIRQLNGMRKTATSGYGKGACFISDHLVQSAQHTHRLCATIIPARAR